MIYERSVQKCPLFMFTRGQYQVSLYNSKFDFTAKSLVTNAVVTTRVLCISFLRLNFVLFCVNSKQEISTHLHTVINLIIYTNWIRQKSDN